MATALQAEAPFSQMLQCPICLETFKRPKVLPCGHTYCATCLQSHISNKVSNKGTPKVCFPCPVCRADTPASNPDINIDQWAESLPLNSIVSSLLDVYVDKKTRNYCEPCLKLMKESLATCFCKECDQSMCMTCKKYHDGFPALRPHGIISFSDGDESSFLIPNLSSIEVCPTHSGERIKFFCSDHDTVCCNNCVILDHRKCDRVVMIDDIHKSLDNTMISKQLECNLSKFEEHLKELIHKTKVNADTIQKEKADILHHIHSLKAELIAKLQKLEDDIIVSLESNYKSENLNLQARENRGQSLITAIHNNQTQLELVMIHGSEVQKFIMLHNLDQSQSMYFQAISEYQKDIKEVRMTFDVDKTFRNFLDNINEIGKVNLICKDFVCSPCPDVSETQFRKRIANGTVRTPLSEGKAIKVSEFNVKVSGDTHLCHITYILHLEDRRILLTDFHNSKIKMFGQDYQYQESMTLQSGPWSVCSLSDTKVAVTIPHHKTIQIIGITDKMLKVRDIRTRLHCWGIAIVNDQLVITTSGDEHLILILDMNGKEIRTVRANIYQADKLFHPVNVKPDTTNSAIYITYETEHKLVAHNMICNLMVIRVYRHMTNLASVDTDREGNIYLCGYFSQCVHQISAEGKLIKILIITKDEKKKPLRIRFYTDKDIFIVSYDACDIVDVYELRV